MTTTQPSKKTLFNKAITNMLADDKYDKKLTLFLGWATLIVGTFVTIIVIGLVRVWASNNSSLIIFGLGILAGLVIKPLVVRILRFLGRLITGIFAWMRSWSEMR